MCLLHMHGILHALVLSHIIASRVGETTAQITPTVRDQKSEF